jgi:hypothetical protein
MRTLGLTVTFLSSVLGWALLGPAQAEPLISAPSQGALCRAAIGATERTTTIPPRLMAAIAMVESGRQDPVTGRPTPWPWTVEAEGQGNFYDTKAQAITAVRALQARGIHSIDVGCMQINLLQHPNAFTSLEQAFDPTANAIYAARFLTELYGQTHDWPRATGLYHSATPGLGIPYAGRVMVAWAEERRTAGREVLLTLDPPANPVRPVRPTGGLFQGGIAATLPHLAAPLGRDLTAYRAAPILFAFRAPPMVARE